MSPDQINALYQKYLGRAANPDEISGWQSGQYGATDPASVEAQIAASGEAQARQGGGGYGSDWPVNTSGGLGTVGDTVGGASSGGGDLGRQISGWYQQYLGRAATPDEIANWQSGQYGPTDPASIQQQIASSGEAKARQGGSGGSGGGGGGYGGGLGGGDNPFGPWTGSYTAPTATPLPPAPGQPGGAAWIPTPTAPTFTAPGYKQAPAFSFTEAAPTYTTPGAFSYADFKAPTYDEAMADPGTRVALQRGTDAIQNAAAAKGTLADSGTFKALEDYGINTGNLGYQNVWNRDYQGWTANRGNALDTYTTNVKTQVTDPYNAAMAQWMADKGLALDTYGANVKTQYDDPNTYAYKAATDAFAPQMAQYGAAVNSIAGQNQAGQTGWLTTAQNTQHGNDLANTNAWNDYLLSWQDYEARRNLGANFALQS
jgi:hypothetical protein